MSDDVELNDEARIGAIEHLQSAIRELAVGNLPEYTRDVGRASRVVSEDLDIPYHVQDVGEPTIPGIGPSISTPEGHSVFLTLPGKPTEYTPNHDFAVNFYDHLHVYVDGERKGEPVITIQSDEFPTQLRIDDVENSFTGVGYVERDT